VSHHASPAFWAAYRKLPAKIRALADERFELLKSNPRHPSLRWKNVGRYWSARIDQDYRALAVKAGDDFIWFWIGRHAEYDQIRQGKKK
jgi:uncharacterized protein (DUF427 family)